MTVFYTSDTHFNHPFVATTRGFETAEEHDEIMIERLNWMVKPHDQLWILGDLFMGSMTLGLEKVARLNGTKHLILGNHDAGHPMHKRSHVQLRRYMDVFESVQLHDMHKFGDRRVMVSHYPYRGDHKPDDRDLQWRLRDEGLPILHGHVHAEWAVRGNQINVGVDRNLRMPAISREGIIARLNGTAVCTP